ncbi:hypothetical protein HIM_10593 [Hirsutella minnesotensis 3608]|uniref:HAT C-terminal dimerisation domain-containing protein n=1 Tax=Hirsutella minnesotensis 3608 TaxID=1043627 RepID=A0A0F7ZX31_9HYPO|nr:hypothetical protein HIM_10593 [Hirsutella minnesotensis 3608]
MSETDSACIARSSFDVISLPSSALDHEWRHGRRYHGHHSGAYIYPNDEEEQIRLDMIHQAHLLLHGGSLFLSSIDLTGRSILDIGTGTGIWAVQIADKYPSASVVGLDLSPIQPQIVPPNVQFYVEDVERDWNEIAAYDFIHCRGMSGSITDWPTLFHKIYQALRPGGIIEIHEMLPAIFLTNQEPVLNGPLVDLMRGLVTAHSQIGRSLDPVSNFRTWTEEAGLIEFSEEIFEIPLGSWPEDQQRKNAGKLLASSFNTGLHALTAKAFRDVLSWSTEEVEVFNAYVRQELRQESSRRILHVSVCTARRSAHMDDDEYDVYCREPIMMVSDPLKWWLDPAQRRRFPGLSSMAIDILSIASMSAETEWLFSKAKLSVTDQRGSMNVETLNLLECLRSWDASALRLILPTECQYMDGNHDNL